MNETTNEVKNITLEDLGYGEFFESNRKEKKLDVFSVARVISEHKGAYKVKATSGEYLAKITGKQMFNALSREDYPAVGDWVAITELDHEHAVIKGVLPRRTVIKRKYNDKNEVQIIAANIDTAFVIESIGRDFNLNRFERYLAIVKDSGIKSVIILNKIDLIPANELDVMLAQIKNRFPGFEIILTSTKTDNSLSDLQKHIERGKTYCFLGSSGVGKSSLINKLLGKNIVKTEDVSLHTGRGKHATTTREMYFLENGGIVIDNPGMREVGMTDAGLGIDNVFDEITAMAQNCKFTNCSHIHEPGCAVLSALKSGKLDEGQYSNFINLKKEAEYYSMNKFQKREKSREFGKFINQAKKDLKKYNKKDY